MAFLRLSGNFTALIAPQRRPELEAAVSTDLARLLRSGGAVSPHISIDQLALGSLLVNYTATSTAGVATSAAAARINDAATTGATADSTWLNDTRALMQTTGNAATSVAATEAAIATPVVAAAVVVSTTAAPLSGATTRAPLRRVECGAACAGFIIVCVVCGAGLVVAAVVLVQHQRRTKRRDADGDDPTAAAALPPTAPYAA